MRLCVVTIPVLNFRQFGAQPPSCGCVLKHIRLERLPSDFVQPPSCGCVLKQTYRLLPVPVVGQPPSCGCVLKLFRFFGNQKNQKAAAFVRLCVETSDFTDCED